MAEAAGTAIGIISFGLQLYTGLSEYLDAVKGREEDLLQAKNNARTLQCSLKAIEDTMSQFNGNAIAQDAVEECKSSCESELKALHELLINLQGKPINPSDPVKFPNFNTKIDEILAHLRSAETVQTQVAQLVSYPKDLQVLCDAVSNVSLRSEPRSLPPNPHTIRSITDQRGRAHDLCNCAKRQNIQRSRARLGLIFFETELKRTSHHAPECPLSQVVTSTEQKRNAVGFSIPNILNILTSAVGVSISLTTGAGGFSLAQNITWSPTVDDSLSPAFQLVRALCDLKTWTEPSLGKKEYEMIAKSCVRRLHLCYANRQASPLDMNSNGESVLDVLASGMTSYPQQSLGKEAADDVAFVFRSIAAIEVPITYDRGGERSILKEFPQIAQSLGFNPLSIAILREDEGDVRFLIKRYPSFKMEVNYCGQSPVHIAVVVGNLDILSLVIENTDPEAINVMDSMKRYPIDYAVSHFLGKPKADDQHSCVSCKMVELLLDSKAVLYELSLKQGLWDACTRTKTAILQHLAQRRQELEQLAVSNLPTAQVKELGLCRGWILDRTAFEVQRSLTAQSCNVPSYLKVRCDKQPAALQETQKSVYTYILDRETAEYAFSLGFDRETAFIDVFRRVIKNVIRRGSLGWPSPWYIDWILECGADLTSTVPVDFMPGVVDGATWAHYLMSVLGFKARIWPYRLYDNALPQSVADAAFSEVLGDDCRCHCSSQGCTPLIKFLEGLGCRRRFPRTWFTLTEGIRSFVASIQALIAGEHTAQNWMPRAVLRYATFCALGLRHTCCKHSHGGFCSIMDSDEIDEIHEEDSATLQQLEELVTYFGNGYGSMTTLDTFLRDVWLPKMREVYREMASYRITEEQLKKAEDFGVKLAIADSKPALGCEPPPGSYFSIKVDVDEPEGHPDIIPIGLDGWMRRFDEIAIDPDRPVFVTPVSLSTTAEAQTSVSLVT
ncbi:hypothetical protein BFJ72_g5481 [Fusarium proliferatum]|uniref:Uncharacterized protein n=1 Tax=Gibberella intermedia TaxID=948311 RepID=A0A420TJI4_GIBIN|nr:hypothetical protein BFJ72_g5481 [Fusarium proliferatum]